MKKLLLPTLLIALCSFALISCHDYGPSFYEEASAEDYRGDEFKGAFGDAMLEDEENTSYAWANGVGNLSASAYTVITADQPQKLKKADEFAKKIIRTANMRAEIEDYDKFRGALAQAIHQNEAFVSNENETSLKHSIEGDITIKVPAANFDALVTGISALAPKWNKKDITSKDVSDEYYDLETRIGTKEVMEEQYLEILKKAKTIDEILQVQGQLRVIREEIESSKGRLKYLASQVGMSTIHLSLFQKVENNEPMIAEAGFFSKAGDRFGEGWDDMQSFFLALIEGWPTILILGLIAFGFWEGVKWLIRRQPKTA